MKSKRSLQMNRVFFLELIGSTMGAYNNDDDDDDEEYDKYYYDVHDDDYC